MNINNHELTTIQKILFLPSNVSSLDKYLEDFSRGIANLIDCEYYAISLLPNQILNRDFHFFSNNPTGFNEQYIENFIHRDELLRMLYDNPNQIHSFKYQNGENEGLKSLHRDVGELRPAQDFCYTPLKYGNSIVGFMGHAKGERDFEILSEKEFGLISMLLPAFQTGIEFFSFKEKLKLQALASQGDELIATIYVSPAGDIEDTSSDSLDHFKEILRIQEISTDVLKKIEMNLPNSESHQQPELIDTRKGIISFQNENYVLSMITSNPKNNETTMGMKMITLEKQKSLYNIDLYSRRYCLTKSEYRIVELISQGFSNKQISNALFIAEATVKKHVSHIFEKTSSKSRYEIITSLSHM